MKKFKITFKHTVEITRNTIVEAETEEEAKALFDYEPFNNDVEDEDEQGLEIEVLKVEEIIEE
jgi:hypothetical protein